MLALRAALVLAGSLILYSGYFQHGALAHAMWKDDPPTSCGASDDAPKSAIDNSKVGTSEITSTICVGGTEDGRVPTPAVSDDTVNAADDKKQPTVDSPTGRPRQICEWYDLREPAESGRWGNNSPSDGRMEGLRCGAPANDGTGMGSNLVDYRFVASGPGARQPTAPPPPDPAVLADQAIGHLKVPRPSIVAGPDRAKLAVNLWTWLWVDDPGQLSVTVAAGGVSVTANATLTSVTWSLGEPATAGDTFQPGSPVTVTCQSSGTAPPANFDWSAEPPCGHKFRWRSLKERTGGTGTWPITATTNWTVTWASNTGVTGGTTLNATSNDQFDVGEYRTVLVQGPGR